MRKVIALGAAAAVTLALSADAFAGNGTPIDPASANVLTLAVYGDSPYGTSPTDTAQFEATPAFIDSINADPKVDLVLHVGDVRTVQLGAGDPAVAALAVTLSDTTSTASTAATVPAVAHAGSSLATA
jgi:hypothetical protein